MQAKRVMLLRAKQEEKVSVCAYARVSTDKDDQAESYHIQESYWIAKLATEPKYHFIGMFGDEAISGATQRKRRGFLEMIKLCRMARIKTIFTKSVARFGRNTQETLKTIQELREMGVTVVFESDGIDTAQLTDELMLRLKAILAEEELKTMSQRVKWSARIRYSQGSVELIHIYGYDVIRSDKQVSLVINENEAKIVRLIYDLYLDGKGFTAIAHYLQDNNIPTKFNKTWSNNQIDSILKNEKYMGDVLLQKTITENGGKANQGEVAQYYIENNHEPIIDKETFYKAQVERACRASKIKFKTQVTYSEFTSKIECGYCGKNYSRRMNTKIRNFGQAGWMCRTANNRGVTVCPSNTINEELLKSILVDAFNEYLATPKMNQQTDDISQEIQKIVEEEKNLRQLFQEGKISYSTFTTKQKGLKDRYKEQDDRIAQEQGFELYTKEGRIATEYSEDLMATHIDKIIMNGYKITFIFKNKQEIVKEWKYEHRRYCKAY